MTELRQRMLEELERRNFAPSTIRYYIRTIRDFAAYVHKPPDQLGVEEIRQFQLHMLRDQKLATGTVENRMTALHFFFKKVLRRHDPELYNMKLTRVPKKLPVVLSPEEVEKLIAAAPNIRYRTILLLLYATGLRRAEAARVKIAQRYARTTCVRVTETIVCEISTPPVSMILILFHLNAHTSPPTGRCFVSDHGALVAIQTHSLKHRGARASGSLLTTLSKVAGGKV